MRSGAGQTGTGLGASVITRRLRDNTPRDHDVNCRLGKGRPESRPCRNLYRSSGISTLTPLRHYPVGRRLRGPGATRPIKAPRLQRRISAPIWRRSPFQRSWRPKLRSGGRQPGTRVLRARQLATTSPRGRRNLTFDSRSSLVSSRPSRTSFSHRGVFGRACRSGAVGLL
jgi:hypothetical protein